MSHEFKEFEREARKILGGKIIGTVLDDSDEENLVYGFRILRGIELFNVFVLADEEGNGPGAIAVEKVKEEE